MIQPQRRGGFCIIQESILLAYSHETQLVQDRESAAGADGKVPLPGLYAQFSASFYPFCPGEQWSGLDHRYVGIWERENIRSFLLCLADIAI